MNTFRTVRLRPATQFRRLSCTFTSLLPDNKTGRCLLLKAFGSDYLPEPYFKYHPVLHYHIEDGRGHLNC